MSEIADWRMIIERKMVKNFIIFDVSRNQMKYSNSIILIDDHQLILLILWKDMCRANYSASGDHTLWPLLNFAPDDIQVNLCEPEATFFNKYSK